MTQKVASFERGLEQKRALQEIQAAKQIVYHLGQMIQQTLSCWKVSVVGKDVIQSSL